MRGRDVSRPGFAGVRVDPRKDKEKQRQRGDRGRGTGKIEMIVQTMVQRARDQKVIRGSNTIDNQTREVTEVYTAIQQCGWTPACIEY